MDAPPAFDDRAIVGQVIDLHNDLAATPLGSRLRSIEFGATDLWSAFRYELSDVLYDSVWKRGGDAKDAGQQATTASIGRIQAAVWQGMWGLDLFSGMLEGIGALEALETVQFVQRARTGRRAPAAPVAVVGFAHQPRLVNGPPFASRPETPGVAFQLLVHDDNVWGHRRAIRVAKETIVATESFLQWRDFRDATRRAREVEAILAPGELRATRYSDAFHQFRARAVHRRRFRRLSLGAEAVRRFIETAGARTFVIPDERQPLAQAAAIAAKRFSNGRIVAVCDPVDQLVRKMPYWSDVVSDAVVVSNAGVQHALTRSGISDGHFKVCPTPALAELLRTVETAPADVSTGRGPGRAPAVLYCDQGLPGSSDRFTQLAECMAATPQARLIFRPHPVQSSFLLGLVVKGGTVVRTASIVDAIRSSDVVVTYSSMVATIASLMERPVILWNPAPSPTMPALLVQQAAYWARTRDELSALIRALVESAPDHPLRQQQVLLKRDLMHACSEPSLEAVL